MKGSRILLWALARVNRTTFKIEPSLLLRSTRLYSLKSCCLGWCWWWVKFPVPLLTLLQLRPGSYLVPCISVRMFIIPKLQNIYCELFSLCIEHLPHCYSDRQSSIPDWSLWEHFSRALPTAMIFYRLGAIPSDRLFKDDSTELKLNTLKIIVKWLQVSVCECKSLRLKIQFVSRELVPGDRATCTIGSRVNFFPCEVEVRDWEFGIRSHQLRNQCNQYSKYFYVIVDALQSLLVNYYYPHFHNIQVN